MRRVTCLLYVLSLLMLVACTRNTPASIPPTPRPAIAPPAVPEKPTIVEFKIEPSVIERGHAAVLTWRVERAYEVHIEPDIGLVQAGGMAKVSPVDATKYTMLAKGPGGSAGAVAVLAVNVPMPPPIELPKSIRLEQLASELHDVYFDYNKSELRGDATDTLSKAAEIIKRTGIVVRLEGHCDERGSAEYNLAMGDRRAQAVKAYLVGTGVPEGQIMTVSYGKEMPQCIDANEDCWQRNRCVHFHPLEPDSDLLIKSDKSSKSLADSPQ